MVGVEQNKKGEIYVTYSTIFLSLIYQYFSSKCDLIRGLVSEACAPPLI